MAPYAQSKRGSAFLRIPVRFTFRYVMTVVLFAFLACTAVFMLFGSRRSAPSAKLSPRAAALSKQHLYTLPPYPQVYESPPPAATVERRPPHERARVTFLTTATSVNEAICTHWASALLSGFATTTAGFGRKHYGHLDKLALVKEACDVKAMRDWDVVFYVDQDTLYTGQDMQPFVDDFIRLSPEHPDDINVRKIRQGKRVAPFRFTAEPWCTNSYSLGDPVHCTLLFDALDEAVEGVAARDRFAYAPRVNITRGRGVTRFLNAGGFIARVWAIKELLSATPRYTTHFPFPGADQRCDQSVYTALYLDHRFEEVRLGLLAPDAHLTQAVRVNQFGLHYGLIDIWQENRTITLVMNYPPVLHQADGYQYGVNYGMAATSVLKAGNALTVFASAILHEAHDPASRVTERHLGYVHPSGTQSIPIAPPLLSFAARLMDLQPDGSLARETPTVLHFADRHKTNRMRDSIPLTGWHIAMELVPGQKQRSLQLVRTAVVEVITGDGIVKQIDVNSHCGHWITEFVEQSRTLR